MMPAYNAADTVVRAIKSMQCQTYENWRLVVVDDGSADATSDRARSVGDDRVTIIRLPVNKGRGVARQVALEACDGEYLGFLDADDWVMPEKLEMQVGYLEGVPTAAAVSTAMYLADEGGGAVKVRGIPKEYEGGRLARVSVRALPRFARAPTILRMNVAQKGYFDPDLKRSQDLAFLLAALTGEHVGALREPLYVYEQRVGAGGWRLRREAHHYHRRVLRANLCLDPVASTARIARSLLLSALFSACELARVPVPVRLARRGDRAASDSEYRAYAAALERIQWRD